MYSQWQKRLETSIKLHEARRKVLLYDRLGELRHRDYGHRVLEATEANPAEMVRKFHLQVGQF